MVGFGTRGVSTEERVSSGGGKYLPHGIVKAKIVSMVVQKAKNTESRRVVFNLESEPVVNPEFKGIDGAKGKIGRMSSMYMGNEKSYADFMRQLAIIAEKMNLRTQLDAIPGTGVTFEEYMVSVNAIFTGRYLWWNIKGEEYDEKKVSLNLMRYGFCKALSEIDESTLKHDGYIVIEAKDSSGVVQLSFDKANKFHFVPYVKPDEGYNLPGAAMFQVPKGPDSIGVIPPPQKEFSVSDLPSFEPADNENDLPF